MFGSATFHFTPSRLGLSMNLEPDIHKANPRNAVSATPPPTKATGTEAHMAMPTFSSGCWGFELRPSHLLSKHSFPHNPRSLRTFS